MKTAEFKKGDLVRLKQIPEWIDQIPEESQAVVRHCLGRACKVDAVEEDCLILDVSKLCDKKFGGSGNEIFVEPKYLELVPVPKGFFVKVGEIVYSIFLLGLVLLIAAFGLSYCIITEGWAFVWGFLMELLKDD